MLTSEGLRVMAALNEAFVARYSYLKFLRLKLKTCGNDPAAKTAVLAEINEFFETWDRYWKDQAKEEAPHAG